MTKETMDSNLTNEDETGFSADEFSDLMGIDDGPNGKYDPVPWTLKQFKQIVNRWQEATLHGWGSLFWSNHDQPRAVSRGGHLGFVEHLDGHGIAGVDQRWKAHQHLALAADFHQLGQLAEVPRGVAGVGESGRDCF